MAEIRRIPVQPLTPEAFAPFGEVLGPGAEDPVTMPKVLATGLVRFGSHVGAPPPGFDAEALDILHLWHPGVRLVLGGELPGVRYMVVHPRPLECHLMERHLKGSQTFIPLEGGATVMAVAPPAELDNPEAVPDPAGLTAFLLDGSRGINIRPGTWHWTAIPVGPEPVAFITLARAKVRLDDMWFVDLRQRLGLTFELVLPGETR